MVTFVVIFQALTLRIKTKTKQTTRSPRRNRRSWNPGVLKKHPYLSTTGIECINFAAFCLGAL